MNRKDLIPIIILVALLLLWGPLSRLLFPPPDPPPYPLQPPVESVDIPPEKPVPPPDAPHPEYPSPPLAEDKTPEPKPRPEERRLILANEHTEIEFTSLGAGIRYIRLLDYRASIDPDSDPVMLDFKDAPALNHYAAEFSRHHSFEILRQETDRVHFAATTESGLAMSREFFMDPDNPYRFFVRDIFENTGSENLSMDGYEILLGPFRPDIETTRRMGMPGMNLSIDALLSGGGQRVRHWSRSRFLSREESIGDLFYPEGYSGGCSPIGRRLPKPLAREAEKRIPAETDWIAVKNKFFVQILAPEHNARGHRFNIKRKVPEGERPDLPETWSSSAEAGEISAALEMDGFNLEPGEQFERNYSYYAGPKKLSDLQPLGNHQENVMEFGRLRFFCRILLNGLNGLYRMIPNYGIAVMLLTILIRILFWPITRKSTESMKRMQELQPEMKALRERHKNNPQKLQQETMGLYRKHKVNPIAGCLPMLIQIPVFFALFTVLRSAVELRFASFLWIRDLSEPENLLAGSVPLLYSLNILPVLMTVTMVWQQHLTPSGGDPSQRKMMMFMPIMMLVFFYGMPSALVLYWTTNQCLMIVQLLLQRHRKTIGKEAPKTVAPAAGIKNTPPRARSSKRKGKR